jgi:hypothetical protein
MDMFTSTAKVIVPNNPAHHKAKHDFDELVPSSKSSLRLTPAAEDELQPALELADGLIGGHLASLAVVRRVWMFNSDNITIFRRNGKPVGLCALLLLNNLGLRDLLDGTFAPSEPETAQLAPDGRRPAAIYVWGIVAPGVASEGVKHMSVRFRAPLFRHADLYTRAATQMGERMIRGTGYAPVLNSSLSLFRYVRAANRSANGHLC